MISLSINGTEMSFWTENTLFSPYRADAGTLFMLSCFEPEAETKILDLGCGYGLVGIYCAKKLNPSKVYMLDNDPKAIETSKKNIEINNVAGVNLIISDAYSELNEKDFSVILTNPPYHTDFNVAKSFIEKGFNRLCVGGHMLMVTRRKEWYKNKFTSVFGGVKISEKEGYFVFDAIKKQTTRNNLIK